MTRTTIVLIFFATLLFAFAGCEIVEALQTPEGQEAAVQAGRGVVAAVGTGNPWAIGLSIVNGINLIFTAAVEHKRRGIRKEVSNHAERLVQLESK